MFITPAHDEASSAEVLWSGFRRRCRSLSELLIRQEKEMCDFVWTWAACLSARGKYRHTKGGASLTLNYFSLARLNTINPLKASHLFSLPPMHTHTIMFSFGVLLNKVRRQRERELHFWNVMFKMSALHSLVGMCVCMLFGFFVCAFSIILLFLLYYLYLFIQQWHFSPVLTTLHRSAAALRHLFGLTLMFQRVFLAVICLLIVTFLQWHLAPASHLCLAETADTALPDIHQHPSMTRRSKNRCQCLAFRDLGRLGWHRAQPCSRTHLGSDLATVSCPRSPSFIAQVSRTLMNQWDLPLILNWEMSQRGDEGSPTVMLPVRASVSLTPCLWSSR